MCIFWVSKKRRNPIMIVGSISTISDDGPPAQAITAYNGFSLSPFFSYLIPTKEFALSFIHHIRTLSLHTTHDTTTPSSSSFAMYIVVHRAHDISWPREIYAS